MEADRWGELQVTITVKKTTTTTGPRRASVLKLGSFLAAALDVVGWKGPKSEGAGPAGVASGDVRCVLAPEQTQGPYYIAGEAVRRDIIEGKAGLPLTLRLAVVDASSCKPIGAALLSRRADRRRVQGCSVQPATGPKHPKRERFGVPERWEAVLAEGPQARSRNLATITMGVHRS